MPVRSTISYLVQSETSTRNDNERLQANSEDHVRRLQSRRCQESQRSDPFIECRTDVGIVAFWPDTGSGQHRAGSEGASPVRVTCDYFKPDSKNMLSGSHRCLAFSRKPRARR